MRCSVVVFPASVSLFFKRRHIEYKVLSNIIFPRGGKAFYVVSLLYDMLDSLSAMRAQQAYASRKVSVVTKNELNRGRPPPHSPSAGWLGLEAEVGWPAV